MAATSHSTLPSSTQTGLGSQGGLNRSITYGAYDVGVGSHPYQNQSNHPTEQSQQMMKSNQKPSNAHEKEQDNSNKTNYGTTKTIQLPLNRSLDNKHAESKNPPLRLRPEVTQPPPPGAVDNQHHQANLARSERQNPHGPPKKQQQQRPQPAPNMYRSDPQLFRRRGTPPPSLHQESSTESHNNSSFEKVPKKSHPPQELRSTKSNSMRAAANKQKEEAREQKRHHRYFPEKLKSQPTSPHTDIEQSDYENVKRKKNHSRSLSKLPKSSQSEGEQTDTEKTHRSKKPSHTLPRQHKHHRDDHQTEDNHSSGDDDDNHQNKHSQNKSQKRTTANDPHLPPMHHGRLPYHYDPYFDHTLLPPGHPQRARYPYHDYPPYAPYSGRYPLHHLYEDADNIPPYLAPYHDPYDPFFDYEKRRTQPNHHHHENTGGGTNGHETERNEGAKSQQSRKNKPKTTTNDTNGRKSRHDLEDIRRSHWPAGYYPPQYFDGEDMLEIWRQERNDYLKKKFKPTIHDVLYSQQWAKSDSYLENQRRRAVRDAQGYYFPYKKYTLKDYKDMQKSNNQNPFTDSNETTLDRKERARKRQEYGALVERQMVDNPGTRYIPLREMPQRKPWHLKSGELHDPNVASKRDRALEYAKEQIKSRPLGSTKHYSDKSDQSLDNQFSEINSGRSNAERTDKISASVVDLYD